MAPYNHSTAGFALLFSNSYNKAIRLEAPNIALEFTDGLYIGRDPEGILSFNNVADFKQAGTHYYLVTSVVDNGEKCCIIEFRFGSASAQPYARFRGEDPSDAVNAAGMNNYSRTGTWTRLSVSSSLATVAKTSYGNTFTVTVESLSRTVTFAAPSVLSQKNINVDGMLYYRNVASIDRGTWANYNDDRIVFYENDYTGRDFAAFFIPLEGNTETLQVNPLNTQTISGGVWS